MCVFPLLVCMALVITQIVMCFSIEKIGHTETSGRNDGGLRTEAAVVNAGGKEFQCCDQGYLLSFHTPQADPADTNIFL